MREIPLRHSAEVALVDDEDYARLSAYSWYLDVSKSGNTYPRTRVGNKNIRMHRLLMGTPLVDHEDGNGLNNQKHNLRPSNKSLNAVNQRLRTHEGKTAKYKGVYLYSEGKWRAQTKIQGKKLYLGTFATPEEAARAYDEKVVELFGEHARTNVSLGLLEEEAP